MGIHSANPGIFNYGIYYHPVQDYIRNPKSSKNLSHQYETVNLGNPANSVSKLPKGKFNPQHGTNSN
jgi:hypothetical protein